MPKRADSPIEARIRVWTRPPQRSRGPAPAYSRERIADAAIAIADSDGLDAVTMRRVAAELGTGAMSLYRYVESKEGIFELMGDRMLGRQEWRELTGDWRTDLADLARGQRALLLAHPWLLRIWSGRPGFGPHTMRGFERSLSIVDGLGLDIDAMLETVSLVDTWVNGYVRAELDAKEFFGGSSDEDVHHALGPYLEQVMSSGQYPLLTRVLTDAASPHIEPDARFERALQRILAGVEATLPGRRGA
ncbi:TetR/AcrR family transcriptional regulator [Prauserella muralis]|uniref:TetR family transcriptional regulator n=1 Tax=Prauserella muralis TaxID=588067 RepID=A0A2V4B1X0_9PSEU|nr:TetR/AcrR family transcriptional regulator [Prauserella muralis]PXY28037.1 TetR family transcriptional regulator [Prauserella muralis]TWE22168.1 TetR family transcriptional regulator [Prauserella muralis]